MTDISDDERDGDGCKRNKIAGADGRGVGRSYVCAESNTSSSNKDVSNLKPRLRTMLSTVSAHALASTAGDTAPMIKTAGDFIDAI